MALRDDILSRLESRKSPSYTSKVLEQIYNSCSLCDANEMAIAIIKRGNKEWVDFDNVAEIVESYVPHDSVTLHPNFYLLSAQISQPMRDKLENWLIDNYGIEGYAEYAFVKFFDDISNSTQLRFNKAADITKLERLIIREKISGLDKTRKIAGNIIDRIDRMYKSAEHHDYAVRSFDNINAGWFANNAKSSISMDCVANDVFFEKDNFR